MSPDPRYHDEMLEQPLGWDIERCLECNEPVGKCEHTTNVIEMGDDVVSGEPVYDDDLGPTVRTDRNVTTHGFDRLPPIGGSKWSSRYTSEKTGGVFSDALMHPQIADIAQGIGHGVTNVLHGIGQGVSWLGDAMTHPLQSHLPASAVEKIQKIKEIAGVYPAGSYQRTHLQQQASDLASNAQQLNSLPKAVVGIGADAMAALSTHPLVTKGIPKLRENLGIGKPKPPHLDFSEMTEK